MPGVTPWLTQLWGLVAGSPPPPPPPPSSLPMTLVGTNMTNLTALTGQSNNDQATVNLAQQSYYQDLLGDPHNSYNGITPFSKLASGVGVPTCDFNIPFFVPQGGSTLNATITFPGKANVSFRSSFSGGCSLGTPVYNSGTDVTTIPLTIPPLSSQVNCQLDFINTQITGSSATDTGLAALDIRLNSDIGNTNIWTAAFKSYLSPFSILRSMDTQGWFAGTNNDSQTTTWASRMLPGLANGAVENIITLGNETGKAVWICTPMFVTQDYLTNLATYCNAHATGVVYIEPGNEWWNNAAGLSHNMYAYAAQLFHGALCDPYGGYRHITGITFNSSNIATVQLDYSPTDLTVNENLHFCLSGAFLPGSAAVVTSINLSGNSFTISGITHAAGSISLDSNSYFMSTDVRGTVQAIVSQSYSDYYVYDVCSNYHYYVAGLIAATFKSITGSKFMTQFRVVFADQMQANQDPSGEIAQFEAITGASASSQLFAWAGAPYHNLDGSNAPGGINQSSPSTTQTVAAFALAAAQSMAYMKVHFGYESRMIACLDAGIQHMTYEGGADLSSLVGNSTANINNAQAAKQNSAWTSGLSTWYLPDMAAAGFFSFNQYSSDLLDSFTAEENSTIWGWTTHYNVSANWVVQGVLPYQALTSSSVTYHNLVTAAGTTVINGYEWANNYPGKAPYFTRPYGTATPGLYTPYQNKLPYFITCDQACTKTLVINYCCDYGPLTYGVKINGTVQQTVTFSVTGSDLTSNPTNSTGVSVTFLKGANSFTLVANQNHGGPNNNEAINTLTFS